MKIILQEENEVTEENLVSLSDEGFNLPGWVTIQVGNFAEDIHIDGLHHAAIALYSKYRNQLDKENDL